jgi:hypothetical protein
MHWPVAREASRSIGIADGGGLAVNTLAKFFHFVGMAGGALCRGKLGCDGYFMMVAVTGLAIGLAQSTMGAERNVCRFVGVTSGALNPRDFVRMRIVLDAGMAILASQSPVNAGGMFCRIDGDILTAVGLHPRLPMTGETVFILRERLGWLRLGASRGRPGRRGEKNRCETDYHYEKKN